MRLENILILDRCKGEEIIPKIPALYNRIKSNPFAQRKVEMEANTMANIGSYYKSFNNMEKAWSSIRRPETCSD